MIKRTFSLFVLLLILFTVTLLPTAALADTVLTATDNTSFNAAITTANTTSGEVTIEISGKVEYTNSSPSLGGTPSKIHFVGKTADAEISITRNGQNGYISGTGSAPAVAFTNLKLSKPAGSFAGDAGFMNVAFSIYRVASVSYTNCTFPNGACAAGPATSYSGCTFQKSHEKYALWAYSADVTVDNCTFDCDRGVKMYAEGKAKTTSLSVTNSDFSKLTGKPAIVLTYGESVALANNIYSSTGVFELDLDGDPDGTPLRADNVKSITCENDNGPCGVIVDGKLYTTAAAAKKAAAAGSQVILLHDSQETVTFQQGVRLDKNGYPAVNVTVEASPEAAAADIPETGDHSQIALLAALMLLSALGIAMIHRVSKQVRVK